MLVTRRRATQSVFIGENVEIKVLEIGPGWVKLGISAPKEISVLRAEQRLTRDENLIAARPVPHRVLASLAEQMRPDVQALDETDARAVPHRVELTKENPI